MWAAFSDKQMCDSMKNRARSKCISGVYLTEHEFKACTTAMLSEKQTGCLPCQSLLQVAFTDQNGEQLLYGNIHREPLHQPLALAPVRGPDASVNSEIEGAGGVSKLAPFHSLQKLYHQVISARAETFK